MLVRPIGDRMASVAIVVHSHKSCMASPRWFTASRYFWYLSGTRSPSGPSTSARNFGSNWHALGGAQISPEAGLGSGGQICTGTTGGFGGGGALSHPATTTRIAPATSQRVTAAAGAQARDDPRRLGYWPKPPVPSPRSLSRRPRCRQPPHPFGAPAGRPGRN